MKEKETKTIKEKIDEIINSDELDMDADSWEKIVKVAYWYGREKQARTLCNRVDKIFEGQQERALEVRYWRMASKVVGPYKNLYSPDYAMDYTNTFGDDKTEL